MFSTTALRITTFALAGLVLVSAQDAEAQSRRGGGNRFERTSIVRSSVINRQIRPPTVGGILRQLSRIPPPERALRPIVRPIARVTTRPVLNNVVRPVSRTLRRTVGAPVNRNLQRAAVRIGTAVNRAPRTVPRAAVRVGRRVVDFFN